MSKVNYTSPEVEPVEILLEYSVADSDGPSFEGMNPNEEDWSK